MRKACFLGVSNPNSVPGLGDGIKVDGLLKLAVHFGPGSLQAMMFKIGYKLFHSQTVFRSLSQTWNSEFIVQFCFIIFSICIN